MQAVKYNLTFEQGAAFHKRITWKDKTKRAVNLAGRTALMQVRDKAGGTVLLELSTENGRIKLGAAPGAIDLDLTGPDTAALDFTTAVYDLYVYNGADDAVRIIEGKVTLSHAVTRRSV